MSNAKKCWIAVEGNPDEAGDYFVQSKDGNDLQNDIMYFNGKKWCPNSPDFECNFYLKEVDISTLIGDEKVSDEEIEKEANWRFTSGHGATDEYAASVFFSAAGWMRDKLAAQRTNKTTERADTSPSIGVQGNEGFNNNPLTFQEVINNYEVHIRHLEEKLKSLQGNVWVKASERTSMHYEDVFIKLNGVSKMIAYYDSSVRKYRAGTRIYDLEKIEWLSESPLSDNKEDVDKK